jgi:transcriptional regulator with XRE-family HTH domain
MKQMSVIKFFVSNLNNYIAYHAIDSIESLAYELNITPRRLKSWLLYSRIPTLSTIDYIADRLHVKSSQLIGENINFQTHEEEIIINDSRKYFHKNLRKYLNNYDIKNGKDFEYFFDKKLSRHTYYSYFKGSPRIPCIRTLELIASYFDVPPKKLIERTDNNAK